MQIREYRSQTSSPTIQNAPNVSAEAFGGGLGRGLRDLGQGVMEAADSLDRRKKKQEEYEARKKAMQEQQDIIKHMEEQRKSAPPGAEGFTENVMKELDERRAKVLEEAPSEYMRQSLDLQFSNIHLATFREAQGFEAESMARKQRQDVEVIQDTNNNIVRANPTRAMQIATQEFDMLETLDMDQTVKEGWKLKRKQELYGSAFDGEVTKLETSAGVTSGHVAAMMKKAEMYGSLTSKEVFDQNYTRLQKFQESLKLKEQNHLYADFDEKMDQYQSTGVKTKENIYTQDWIKANVQDPDKRDLMLKRAQIAESVGAAMTFVKDAPADKIKESLKQLEKERETTSDYHVVDAQWKSLKQAVKQRDSAFTADQAGYTLAVSQPLQSLKAEIDELSSSKDPRAKDLLITKFAHYADMQANEQTRLYPGVQPSILGKTEVAKIGEQMRAVSFDEKGAAEALEVLQTEMEKAGDWWPHIVRELSSGKRPAINSSQYVAASLLNKDSSHLATDILHAAAVPRKQLTKELGEGAEKEAYISAKEALGDFHKSLKGMPAGQAEAVVHKYADALTQYALFKQSRNETIDLQDIADEVVNDSYEFEGEVRIPKVIGKAQADTDLIKMGIENAKASLETVELANFPLGDLKPEDAERTFRSSLIRQGKIYTKGDDRGIRVIDRTGASVYTKRNGKVVPLEYTWGELQILGAEQIKKDQARRNARSK